ncbi:MAG: hypothetical protein ACLVJV_02930 [Oscillospiraceae bacterium]
MHSEKNTVVQGPCGSAEARQRGGQVSAVTIRQHRLAQTLSSPSAWTLPPIRPSAGR